MLDVLGWGFDKEGPKSDDYSQLVCALGVKFDLCSCKEGLLNVCHTVKRVRETTALLDEILALGALKKRDAPVVRGRLAFCDAFIFWKVGKGCVTRADPTCICVSLHREDFRCFEECVETFEGKSFGRQASCVVMSHVGYSFSAYGCKF